MPSIIVRNRRLSYWDIGEGFPILFGHSYLWDKRMWRRIVDVLSSQYRCIVPDLWSHGQSEDVPQRPYSLELLSQDFRYIMQSLGLDEFGIIGQSVGGMWGTQLAVNHPKQVAWLVLLDTFVGEEPQERKDLYFSILKDLEFNHAFSKSWVEEVTSYFFSKKTYKTQPSLIKAFSDQLQSISPNRIEGIIEMGHTIFNRQSLLHRLSDLTMPVLIGMGQDDFPRSIEEAKEMNSRMPKSRLEIIPDAGHMACLEQPEECLHLLKEFIEEHDLVSMA